MNAQKIRGRIVEEYGTITKFSDKVGTTHQAVSNRLTGKTRLTVAEAEEWCDALEIRKEEVWMYFFPHIKGGGLA